MAKDPLNDAILGQYQSPQDIIDAFTQPLLGGTTQEMAQTGQQRFPTIPTSSAHHAEAAMRAAQRFGFIPSQIAGLGVEWLEGGAGGWEDIWNDLKANLVGGVGGAVSNEALSRKLAELLFSK